MALPDPESMTVSQAASALHRSERSIRRYLHEGKLEYEKAATGAGFKYLINPASVDRLKIDMQGRQTQGSTVDVSAELAALREMLVAQTEEIAKLRRAVVRLLPPGPQGERKHWWRRLAEWLMP